MNLAEFDEAIKLAQHVLDRPMADPDDDIAILARQFLRTVEASAYYRAAIASMREAAAIAAQEPGNKPYLVGSALGGDTIPMVMRHHIARVIRELPLLGETP
jgi:hypothetical protein